MPRNSSGVMTLVSGNPVVSGTVVSALSHNSTMQDVASEIGDSLSRSGKGPMVAALRVPDGTNTAPTLAFAADTDTGIYLAATGDMRAVAGGVDRLKVATAAAAELKGASADGATAVGVVLDNTVALANTSAKLLSVRNAGTERAYVGEAGEGVFGVGSSASIGVRGFAVSDGVMGTAVGPTDGDGVEGTGYGAGAGVVGIGGGTGPGVLAQTSGGRGALNLVPQAPPSGPADGDVWIANNALHVRINGANRVAPTNLVGADRGDTNQTLAVSADAPIQRWATTLTANRTITLSTSGAENGHAFRVVRTGLGAFTLNVGGLKTIPSATAAYVDVMFDGSAWVLVGYGTL